MNRKDEITAQVDAEEPAPGSSLGGGFTRDNISENSITAPNGRTIRVGDRVRYGSSKIVRVIVGIHGGKVRGVRADRGAVAYSAWTGQLNQIKPA